MDSNHEAPRGLEPKAVIGKDGRTLTVICDGKLVTIPLGFDLEPWARIYLKEQEAKAGEAKMTSLIPSADMAQGQ
jgi:hypothetical protein